MTDDKVPHGNPAARGQAEALRDQARTSGLRFKAYLPQRWSTGYLSALSAAYLPILPKRYSRSSEPTVNWNHIAIFATSC